MSSDIQFGDLEQSEPQLALRPDQDGHFAVAEVGEIGAEELTIFVDLDVMRDMEGHARTNQRVELGGVMLGQQNVDDQGRPFVVITDSLRAEHYEATKGSFKFTHETWSQITRDRERFRPDLEMVGWYHTHPGWGVFLSGMDLFICNNFFNRPLDVALVVEPCADDRGWFQWTEGDHPKTHQTGGFYLITSRYRQQELDVFARIYNKEPVMMQDPRYSGNGFGTGGQPVVNLIENRKPLFELAIVGMLFTQFLLFAVIAWKMNAGPAPLTDGEVAQVAELRQDVADLQNQNQLKMRDQVYQDVIGKVIGPQVGGSELVKSFAELKTANQQMQSNIDAQIAMSDQLKRQNDIVLAEMKAKDAKVETLGSQLVTARKELEDAEDKIKELTPAAGGKAATFWSSQLSLAWWWWLLGAILVGMIGVAAGYALSQTAANDPFEDDDSGRKELDFSAGSAPDAIDSSSDLTIKIGDDQMIGMAEEAGTEDPAAKE